MLAVICVLLAGILWGCIGLFVRPLNDLGLHSMDVVGLRAFVTAVLLLIILLIIDKKSLKIKLKDIWCFIGTGLLSIVFFNFCYFRTIENASMSVASVLLYTAPAIVMVLSKLLFGEKFTVSKIIALVLTFVGCVFVTGIIGSGDVLSVKSICTGLGAGFGYALYSIFGRYASNRGYNTYTITFYTFLFAGLGCIFLSDISNISDVLLDSPKNMCLGIAFGIVSTILPYLLYTKGLKNMENGKASIIASIEPVTATLLGTVVFDESLSLGGLLGMILILGGIAISSRKN